MDNLKYIFENLKHMMVLAEKEHEHMLCYIISMAIEQVSYEMDRRIKLLNTQDLSTH